MNVNIKPCGEKWLPDKAKTGVSVESVDWFASAKRHVGSAEEIFLANPAGSMLLAWSAMHNTAKGLAAIDNLRLENETHGKIVDFLCCVFPTLTDRDKGLIRFASTGRNTLAYDNPRNVDLKVATAILQLARRLLVAAAGGTEPAKPIPPPPPPKSR